MSELRSDVIYLCKRDRFTGVYRSKLRIRRKFGQWQIDNVGFMGTRYSDSCPVQFPSNVCPLLCRLVFYPA